MRFAALAAAALLALHAPAARADYLNTPGELARVWTALAPRIPAAAAIVTISATPGLVVVGWRGAAPRGGTESMTVSASIDPSKPGERLAGPFWVSEIWLSDVPTFAADDLGPAIDLDALLARGRAAVKLGSEARIASVVIGHPESPSDGDGLGIDMIVRTPERVGFVVIDLEGRITHLSVTAQAEPVTARQPEPEPPAPWRGDSGRDLVAGLAAFAAHLGPETRIWEVDARPDRITVERPHPTQPRTTAILTLTERGLREERSFPQMMQTEADLFLLSALASLTPEAIEAARGAGLAAVALPGGQLERLRLWSGAPFWRHPAGEPFFDIRVGVPPQGQPNGYAVVTLAGQVVEAFH